MILRTIREHTQALSNYLPGGDLFAAKSIDTSNLYKFLNGLSPEMLKVDNFIKTYRELIIPDKLDETFILDWEMALGIPDDCFKANGTIEERRTHVLAKLASLGVQTVADFEAMALLFGISVTVVPGIEENGPGDADDRFRIYVRHLELPSDAFPLTFPIVFGSKAISIITCLFDKLKPANCEVIFKQIGWDIDDVTYDSVSLNILPENNNPSGIFFKPDGLTLFMVGQTGDTIYQYTLTSEWDLSTASYASKSFSVTTEDTLPSGIHFKDDGTKLYMIGSATYTVYQYTLSTPWDISTATYDTVSFSVTTEDTSPTGIFFRDDGSKMYMVGQLNDSVYQYTLSTPWDLSTATYDTVSFSVASEELGPSDIFFKPDGTTMYVVGVINDTVYQYALGSVWDLTSASYSSKSFSVNSEDNTPRGIFFRQDNGSKMYVIGSFTSNIYQYTVD